jgi:hypothetical protein
MRARLLLAALWVACLFSASGALAQDYVVKDGNGSPQVMCSVIVGGVQYPCHLSYFLHSGSPVAGAADASGNQNVNVLTVPPPVALTTTNVSSTITSGGSFQSVIAALNTRAGCLIENPTTATEPLYVYFGANSSATAATSISLAPGGVTSCASGSGGVLTDNVSLEAATTGHAFVAMKQ